MAELDEGLSALEAWDKLTMTPWPALATAGTGTCCPDDRTTEDRKDIDP